MMCNFDIWLLIILHTVVNLHSRTIVSCIDLLKDAKQASSHEKLLVLGRQ